MIREIRRKINADCDLGRDAPTSRSTVTSNQLHLCVRVPSLPVHVCADAHPAAILGQFCTLCVAQPS